MLSESSLKQISYIFCGDTEGYYIYKSGGRLVDFFYTYYHIDDVYGQGVPSRWNYVCDKLIDFINSNRFDDFLNIILSKEYLMKEQSLSQVLAAEKAEQIWNEINRIVEVDFYKVIKNNGRYSLIRENDDLELIGSGGFANVYYQKSTKKIVKKLRDDFLNDKGIRSRFKREYDITKSLQGTPGIIEVYTFDSDSCSYTMEQAETTLEKFIIDNTVPEETKVNCIRQVLHVMKAVHDADIIHRDISANNILIITGRLKVADFGLGKDLNMFTSHQTIHTNSMGQYYYCAPEQFMMLKDGDKRSDVYSLGRVINFIMTGDPKNSQHVFRSVAEKSTNSDSAYRYADAGQLLNFFNKAVEYKNNLKNKEKLEEKILKKQFDDEVEGYIYSLTGEEIARKMQSLKNVFCISLIRFMKRDESHAEYVIQSIDKTYQNVCGRSYDAYDIYSFFANTVQEKFSFTVKEIAANIMRYVAWDVNRFNAQHMVEDLLSIGLDPMLEDVIRN